MQFTTAYYLVLIMSMNQGTAMVAIDQKYTSLEQCQAAGHAAQNNVEGLNPFLGLGVAFTCVPDRNTAVEPSDGK